MNDIDSTSKDGDISDGGGYYGYDDMYGEGGNDSGMGLGGSGMGPGGSGIGLNSGGMAPGISSRGGRRLLTLVEKKEESHAFVRDETDKLPLVASLNFPKATSGRVLQQYNPMWNRPVEEEKRLDTGYACNKPFHSLI